MTAAIDRYVWTSDSGPRQFATLDEAMQSPSLTAASPAHDDSVMVALVPPPDVAQALIDVSAGTEPVDEVHITLLFLGTVQEAGGDPQMLTTAVQAFAAQAEPLTGQPNGWGVFHNDSRGDNGAENVLVALWDIPGIAEFRAGLHDAVLNEMMSGLREDTHGFTPHSTMSYEAQPITTVPGPIGVGDVTFSSVVIAWGADPWVSVPLSGLQTSGPPGSAQSDG